MKAIVLANNGNAIYSDIVYPVMELDEVVVKVQAAGICSSDIYRSHFNGAYFYPLIMGHEFCGEISSVGKDENKFNVGDRVAVFPLMPCFKCNLCKIELYAQCKNYKYYGSRNQGGFSQYIAIKKWNLFKLDPTVDYVHGAALEPVATVLHAISKFSNLENGEFLILGAGYLGMISAKFLKMKYPKLRISVVDRNEFKLELISNYIDKKICIQNENDWRNFFESHEGHFSHVLEACGAPKSFEGSVKVAARQGEVVWMGNISGDLKFAAKDISSFLRKEVRLMGTWNSYYVPDKKSDWSDAHNLFKEGFDINEFVGHKINLSEVPIYLQRLADNKKGKISFDCIKVMINEFEK